MLRSTADYIQILAAHVDFWAGFDDARAGFVNFRAGFVQCWSVLDLFVLAPSNFRHLFALCRLVSTTFGPSSTRLVLVSTNFGLARATRVLLVSAKFGPVSTSSVLACPKCVSQLLLLLLLLLYVSLLPMTAL